ncbi:MAG: hypothetical protein ABI592_00780 [Acidobacteriota bacterium]
MNRAPRARRGAVLSLLLAILPWASLRAVEPDRAKLAEIQKRITACHEKKDWPCFLEAAREAVKENPESLRAVYNLACAEARSGDAPAAAKRVEVILDRKYDLGMDADEDLAGVWHSPTFEGAVRKLAALRIPVASSSVAFRLPEKDLVTEGIAHDARTGSFFVSSVHHRKIVRRTADGRVSDFVTEGRDGIQAVLALRADSARRILWACSAALPEMIGWDKSLEGSTALFGFDLDSGRLVRRAELPPGTGKRALNDLALLANGDVYVTDSQGSGVYVLKAGSSRLEAFVEPGVFRSPQGIAASRDGKRLWIADYGLGIWSVDLATRRRTALTAPDDVPIVGVDALLAKNGALVVTQNGIRPQRIVRLTLDAAGTRVVRARILEMNTPELTEPTLGVVVGPDLFYIANAQWEAFDEQRRIFPMEKLHEPTVLKVPLTAR